MMPRRATATIAQFVLAGTVAAAVAGCAGPSDDAVRVTRSGESADPVFAWTRCMRAEGIEVRDPKVGPNGSIEFPRQLSNGSPEYEQAAEKCRRVFRQGRDDETSAADFAAAQEKLLRYARCMREHGVEMPDPQPPPRETKGPPVDIDAPGFQRAHAQCAKALAFPEVPHR